MEKKKTEDQSRSFHECAANIWNIDWAQTLLRLTSDAMEKKRLEMLFRSELKDGFKEYEILNALQQVKKPPDLYTLQAYASSQPPLSLTSILAQLTQPPESRRQASSQPDHPTQ